MSTAVRARIDEKTKDGGTAFLAAIGLMVSDVFQLMMARIGTEQKSLVDPLVHNAETILALKAAR